MLIAIVFIAELIIAFQLISIILKADRKICDINDCVKEFNPLAQTCMQYIRCITDQFCGNIAKSIEFVKKQREKMIFKTITTVALYGILFLFKFKKVKIKKIGNLAGAIRDVVLDWAV